MPSEATRSAGTSPRQATQPVKRGFSGPKVRWRTREWMPSAPTTRSASVALPLSKRADDPLALLLQADEPVADMQPFGRHGGAQKVGQVAAMEVIVGRAERRLDLRSDRRALQGAAVVPAPLVDGERAHADAIQGRLEAEADQEARGVGADLDAGADLADARRLLVDLDVEPGLQQLQGGRQAADAAADDGDPHAGLTAASRRSSP